MYQNIKNLREDADLTQHQIAQLLNISQTTYSRYESGKLDIPSLSLIKLASFYKTSVDYLLGLTNNKTASMFLGYTAVLFFYNYIYNLCYIKKVTIIIFTEISLF